MNKQVVSPSSRHQEMAKLFDVVADEVDHEDCDWSSPSYTTMTFDEKVVQMQAALIPEDGTVTVSTDHDPLLTSFDTARLAD